MAHTYTLQFTHRLNDDGTIDSICRECFTTVATAKSGSALEREEQRHRCDAFLLKRYKKVQGSENFPGSLA
jgi:hypothetical protein